MANREACEVYIEQEIKAALEEGKKPWTIGKELSAWVERLFNTTIKPRTIEKRADRILEQDSTNVESKSQPAEITIKTDYEPPPIIADRKPQGGGAREGAGRPPKVLMMSNAMRFAGMAIAQLDSILPDDPEKNEAMDQVIEYCNARKENE